MQIVHEFMKEFFANFAHKFRYKICMHSHMRYCTFISSLSCQVASVTSYLYENEAGNLQNGNFNLAQIPDFGMGIFNYLENHLAH